MTDKRSSILGQGQIGTRTVPYILVMHNDMTLGQFRSMDFTIFLLRQRISKRITAMKCRIVQCISLERCGNKLMSNDEIQRLEQPIHSCYNHWCPRSLVNELLANSSYTRTSSSHKCDPTAYSTHPISLVTSSSAIQTVIELFSRGTNWFEM
jgi:hypothetical protein